MSKPTFPGTSDYLRRQRLHLRLTNYPLCPHCGKVRLASRRFRRLGACQRCARRGLAVGSVEFK